MIRSIIQLNILMLTLQNIYAVNGARILGIFMHNGNSHFEVFYPIMNGLAERKHNVTVASFFTKPNHHPYYNEMVFKGLDTWNSTVDLVKENLVTTRSLYALYEEFLSLADWGDFTCRATLLESTITDDIIKIHNENPFDLVITEIFDADCMLGVIHKLNVPFIGLSSCALMPWHYDMVGAPDSPSYIPSEFVGYSDKMSFMERVKNWITVKSLKLLYRYIQINDNWILKLKFSEKLPDVAEIGKNIRLILVNQHYSINGAKPLPPQIIEIGGVHISDETKPLPENIKHVLDNSINGVIYISWGSTIKSSSLPTDKVVEILRALAKLPVQIIWKWEDDLPFKSSNIFTAKWLPQKDILCHPKVRAFWSHGGNLGVSEAVHCGVPVVTTPIYGDQFLNAAALMDRGMGLTLPYNNIQELAVYNVFTEILDKKYHQNAKMVSYSYRNRPMSPLRTSIWWIENVLETKHNTFVQSHSVNMSWFTYHSLDVIAFLILGFYLLIFVFKFFFNFFLKLCCKSKLKHE